MEDTRAAWLEGMPPVRHTMVSTTSRIVRFLFSSTTTVLRIWAINQLKTDEKNMGFSTKDFRDSALKEIARAIV